MPEMKIVSLDEFISAIAVSGWREKHVLVSSKPQTKTASYDGRYVSVSFYTKDNAKLVGRMDIHSLQNEVKENVFWIESSWQK